MESHNSLKHDLGIGNNSSIEEDNNVESNALSILEEKKPRSLLNIIVIAIASSVFSVVVFSCLFYLVWLFIIQPYYEQNQLDTTISKISSNGSESSLTNSNIINKIKPAVVLIERSDGSYGSGMIFTSDGYILTNAHVVRGYNKVNITVNDGAKYSAIVTGRDEINDLAVIKINSAVELTTIDFGDSSKVQQGDNIFTFGFPYIKGDVSFKEGTVSRIFSDALEISAEIHPGNSGGPLVDTNGKIIGINSFGIGSDASGAIKFARPINIAVTEIPFLMIGAKPCVGKLSDIKIVDKQYEDHSDGKIFVQGLIKNESKCAVANVIYKVQFNDVNQIKEKYIAAFVSSNNFYNVIIPRQTALYHGYITNPDYDANGKVQLSDIPDSEEIISVDWFNPSNK
jgi:S1-C subfamily serine protease